MKILFVYKYLTPGGVETVLRARLETLHEMGVEAFAWFLGDSGGRYIFAGLEDRIFIGHEAMSLSHLSEFDVISSIDTEEIIPLLRGLPPSTKVIFEVHSPYFENLEYLKSREFRNLNIPRILVPSQYQKQDQNWQDHLLIYMELSPLHFQIFDSIYATTPLLSFFQITPPDFSVIVIT